MAFTNRLITRLKSGLTATLLVLFAGSAAWGETHYFYFGGGGERRHSNNNFDSTFAVMVDLAKTKGWKAEYFVDAGHPSTKLLLDQLQPSIGAAPVSQFSEAAARERINQLRESLSTYKKDDQILLVLNTHGGLDSATDLIDESGRRQDLSQNPSWSGLSYRGDDRVRLSTDRGTADLTAELRRLVEEANRQGRRLTIDLGNCYSGSLLGLIDELGDKNEYVCIIASSNPRRVSYFEYDRFYTQLGYDSLTDMEKAYRWNRPTLYGLSYQPMINTPAGLRASRALSFIKDFAYGPNEEKVATEDRLCSNPRLQVKNLQALGQAVARVTDEEFVKKWKGIDKELPRAIDSLVDARLKHEQNELKLDKLNQESVYGLDLDHCWEKFRNKGFSREQAQQLGLSGAEQICEAIHLEGSKKQPQNSRLVKAREAHKKELEKLTELKVIQAAHRRLAERIIENERIVYDVLYDYFALQTKDKPNPCAGFKL